MGSRKDENSNFGDRASPGKIFVGGLAKDTTLDVFVKHFGKYGEITDSVIMKDRQTGRPRGFGFITYADPSVVDSVIQDVHVINDKEVEIKRTIPKGSAPPTDLKTKKIFVGGIPTSVTEDEFENFFSKYGNVVEREIIQDHATKRSRGFGFVVFDDERVVDELLSGGNMIDMDGTKVEIKKAEPKKPSKPTNGAAYGSEPRGRPNHDRYGGYEELGYGSARSFGPGPHRSSMGGFGGSRFGDYGGYGPAGADLGPGGGYGGYGGGGYAGDGYAGYRGDSPFGGYSSRYGPYGGGGYGRGGPGAGGYGGFGRGVGGGDGYGGYDGSSAFGGYETGGPDPGFGGLGGPYGGAGGRAGYGGSSRYHPYAR